MYLASYILHPHNVITVGVNIDPSQRQSPVYNHMHYFGLQSLFLDTAFYFVNIENQVLKCVHNTSFCQR